jgi:hypothetical protein
MENKFSPRGFAKRLRKDLRKNLRSSLQAASSVALLAIGALALSGSAHGAAISGTGKKISWGPEKIAGPGRAGGARGVRLARRKKAKEAPRPDSRVIHLGSACKQTSDCRGRTQVCLKEQDANGKDLERGLCALPCAAIDAGLGDPLAPTPENVEAAKRPPPPRCPKTFQCRSAGAGVPIDLCIKE